jgi:hypothetical protein
MAYEREATAILQLCDTPLTKRFFSKQNVDRIQTRLAKIVNTKTGYMIDRQSDTEILGIMRGVYDMFSDNVDASEELARLNDIVLEILTTQVVSGVDAYLQYLRDASTLPEPMSRGSFASIKGGKTLEYKVGF